jgi:hypothetical protein
MGRGLAIVSIIAICFILISPICRADITLSPVSWTVSNIGNYWVAQNETGNTVYNSTDSWTVIQDCINSLQSNVTGTNGGTICIGYGSPLLSKTLVIQNPDITLEGQGRATGLSATFNGSLIQILSGSEAPYTTSVTIENLLFFNNNSDLIQTAICLNISGPAIYPITLAHLVIIGMNGIVTDNVTKGTDTKVLINPTISDVYIENAPQFGIKLWATIDATIDNAYITWDSLGPNTPVAGTTGIEITMNGESTGIIITDTRVLRADYGITLNNIRDILITNTIADLCKTWAWNLNGTIDGLFTNIYGTSPTGIAFWLNGQSSQNRITTSTFHDLVKDDTTNRNYFTATVADNWAINCHDKLVNCNYSNDLFIEFMAISAIVVGAIVTIVATIYAVKKRNRLSDRARKVNQPKLPLTTDDYRYYGHACLIFGIILSLIGIAVPLCTMTWEYTEWINPGSEIYMPVAMPYLEEGIILVGIGIMVIWFSQILHREYRFRLKEQQTQAPPPSPQEPS